MKTFRIPLMVLSLGLPLFGLAGCNETTADRQADAVREHEQQKADNVREQAKADADHVKKEYDAAADKVREEVGITPVTGEAATTEAEKKADDLEAVGRAKADAIKRDAEKTADQIEKAAESTADQIEKQDPAKK